MVPKAPPQRRRFRRFTLIHCLMDGLAASGGDLLSVYAGSENGWRAGKKVTNHEGDGGRDGNGAELELSWS